MADNTFRQLSMKVRLAAKNGRARPKNVTGGGVLTGLNQHWSNPKYKEICNQNCKDRFSDGNRCGTVMHYGGSISFVMHESNEMRMKAAMYPRPNCFLGHKKLKGKGKFVDGKSKTIFEKYLAIKETNGQSIEGTSHENTTGFDPVAWHKPLEEPSCFTPKQVRSLLQVPVFQVEVQDEIQIQSTVRDIEEVFDKIWTLMLGAFSHLLVYPNAASSQS